MKKINLLTAFIGTIIPIIAFALNLGTITVHSEIYQPLNADVQLTEAAGIPAQEIHVAPAPNHAYSLPSYRYNSIVNQLNFTVMPIAGDPIIKITSTIPITQPILNFLIQLHWPQGQITKKITLLPQLPGESDEFMPPTADSDYANRLVNEITLLKADATLLWRRTVDKLTHSNS